MRALVLHAPRDLRLEAREDRAPGAGEVAVRLAVGGVCGSDLHYYNHGGFGAVRLREPMILGHEVAGHVEAVGPGVAGLAAGDLVSVSPSRPCGACGFCAEGLPNHCEAMAFYGSAMPFPHIQGAFRERLVAKASQCAKADGLSPGAAAMAEPLSVALHAVARAGDVMGRRALVVGCGPIGCLAVMALRRAGAAEIVAADLSAAALGHARKAGTDMILDLGEDPAALAPYAAGKGTFHLAFECAGAAQALAGCVATLRPRGVLMQLGLGGDMTVPVQAITAKEIDLRGAFRFHAEFPVAVEMMRKGLIDPSPLITHTMALEDAESAFEAANDRTRAMKAQIAFA